MYESDTQAIGAILIQTSAIQEHIPAVGDWEGPFPPSLLYVFVCGRRGRALGCQAMLCYVVLVDVNLCACCLLLAAAASGATTTVTTPSVSQGSPRPLQAHSTSR